MNFYLQFTGTILFEYWTSLREILHRKLSTETSKNPQFGIFQNLQEETVSKVAFDAYSILKYSLPSTNEDAMMNILDDEECLGNTAFSNSTMTSDQGINND